MKNTIFAICRRISPALFLSLLFFTRTPAFSQPTTTRVLDIIYDGAGNKVRGNVEISINEECVVGGNYISGVVVRKSLVNGVLDVNLVPNTNCVPANTRYIAKYRLNGRPEYSEEWLVPISGSSVLISTIKQSTSVLPSQAIGITQLTGCITSGAVYFNGSSFVCQAVLADPLTTNGDLIARIAGVTSRFAIGSSAEFLQVVSGLPDWVTMSGDVTIAAGGVATLANSGVSAASYGTATQVPQLTIDAKGRITVASNVAIAVNFNTLVGAASDVQIPDLNSLSTGLTPSRCVETTPSGLLVSAAGLCGSGAGSWTDNGDGAVTLFDADGPNTVKIRAGSDQSTNRLLGVFNNSDQLMSEIDASGAFAIFEPTGGFRKTAFQNFGVTFASDQLLTWDDNTNLDAGAVDLRLRRSAAKSIGIDDGAGGDATVDVTGQVSASTQFITTANGRYVFNTRGVIQSPSDGVMTLSNFAQDNFTRLNFGGTTSSFPTLKRNGALLQTRLADDSAFAVHEAQVFNANVGFTIGSAASLGAVLRGNGTNFVSATLNFTDLTGAASDAQIPDLDSLSTGLTPSRCVETDASGLLVSTVGVCGAGGAADTGITVSANSYTPTRTSDTVLTLPAIAANFARRGEVGSTAVASSTFTVSSGTGTLWIALASDGEVKVRHNIVGTCSAPCTAVASSTGYDINDIPLYEWTVTSGVLDAAPGGGTLKLTPFASRPLVAGTNVNFSVTDGTITINASGGSTAHWYQYFPAGNYVSASNQDSSSMSSWVVNSSFSGDAPHRWGYLAFPDSASNYAVFHFTLPFTPSSFTPNIKWINRTGGLGDVRVEVATVCLADGDDWHSPTYNSSTFATLTFPITNNITNSWTPTPDITGCTAGKEMFVKIGRVGGDAADTFTASDDVGMTGALVDLTP